MRDQLAKPIARWIKIVSFVEIGGAGFYAAQFIKTHQWWFLIAAIFFLGMGITMQIQHWQINHPKIPKWVEDELNKEVVFPQWGLDIINKEKENPPVIHTLEESK